MDLKSCNHSFVEWWTAQDLNPSADNLTPAFLPFKVRSLILAANALIFGHPNVLISIWFYGCGPLLHNAFTSPYLYDTKMFRKILDKTINFESLRKKEDNNNNDSLVLPRLILNALIYRNQSKLFSIATRWT
jgi:hypothetical protein